MIRILTDSATDFTQEELQKLNVRCVPMTIAFGGDTYTDGVDLPQEIFWQRMEAGQTPKTSQPSPDAFLREFEAAKAAGDSVLCVLISSALSGTLQSALIAVGMTEDPGRRAGGFSLRNGWRAPAGAGSLPHARRRRQNRAGNCRGASPACAARAHFRLSGYAGVSGARRAHSQSRRGCGHAGETQAACHRQPGTALWPWPVKPSAAIAQATRS